jgi:hypothetical protein
MVSAEQVRTLLAQQLTDLYVRSALSAACPSSAAPGPPLMVRAAWQREGGGCAAISSACWRSTARRVAAGRWLCRVQEVEGQAVKERRQAVKEREDSPEAATRAAVPQIASNEPRKNVRPGVRGDSLVVVARALGQARSAGQGKPLKGALTQVLSVVNQQQPPHPPGAHTRTLTPARDAVSAQALPPPRTADVLASSAHVIAMQACYRAPLRLWSPLRPLNSTPPIAHL